METPKISGKIQSDPRISFGGSSAASPGTRAPFAERWFPALSCVSGLLCVLLVFRPFFLSHFDSILSDPGDGRLCITILEHWVKVFHGQVQVASPNFFFPERGVLGYSDTLFLDALPYATLRFLGLDRYLAFEATMMLVTAVGFASMLGLLRRLRSAPGLLRRRRRSILGPSGSKRREKANQGDSQAHTPVNTHVEYGFLSTLRPLKTQNTRTPFQTRKSDKRLL